MRRARNNSVELSGQLLEWARVAGYSFTAAGDAGVVTLWSDPGGEVRYYVSRQGDGWLLLTRSSRGGESRFVLAASSSEVLERYLYGVFGSVIRDDKRLPQLKKPWTAADLARGYVLSELAGDGSRTLSHESSGPVAIAREETLSLINLVPLSHFLELSVPQLQESFLDPGGAPLLSGSSYASGVS